MTQKREIPFGRPWIEEDDKRAVLDVLNGHILTHGPNCEGFEKEFAEFMGGGYATSTSSCMASLHLSYLHLGVGPGDEVIVPSQTHVATVHAVELVGAKPVFVDSELVTGNMDLEKLAAAVTPRTRAISVVHYAGIPVDMPRVMAIANANDLRVIEDCALAVGGRVDGKHVGLFGDTGCYSFYPVKHITSAEGGMFVSASEETVRKVANLRAFNYDRTVKDRKVPGVYDVLGVGLNYRMSELQAALGRTQLKKIDRILARRQENFARLKDALADIDGAVILDSPESRIVNSHYCLIFVLPPKLRARRNDMILSLQAEGVGTSVYYPQPVPRAKYYREKYGFDPAQFVNAATISDHALALPVGPHLTPDDMDYLADRIKAAIAAHG